MKKSELRKIIRKTINEQMGTAGPRPRVPNKGKQHTINVRSEDPNSIKQAAQKIASMKPGFNVEEFMRGFSQIAQNVLTEEKFGDCKCIHPPSMGFCFLGICVGKGGGNQVKLTFNI